MQYYEHITREGERWDTISNFYYGDPHLYEAIMSANPHISKNSIFPSGVKLKVPVMKIDKNIAPESLPPWKR